MINKSEHEHDIAALALSVFAMFWLIPFFPLWQLAVTTGLLHVAIRLMLMILEFENE